MQELHHLMREFRNVEQERQITYNDCIKYELNCKIGWEVLVFNSTV